MSLRRLALASAGPCRMPVVVSHARVGAGSAPHTSIAGPAGARPKSSFTKGLLPAALLAALTLPAAAQAHSNPLTAQPPINAPVDGPVSQVQLTFDSPIVASAASLKVFDPTGAEVDLGGSLVDSASPTVSVGTQPLGSGLYTVVWANQASDDGHSNQGYYLFRVGPTDVPARVAFVGGAADGKGNTVAPQSAGDLQLTVQTPAANLTLKSFDVLLQSSLGVPVSDAFVRCRVSLNSGGLDLPEYYKVAQPTSGAPGHYTALLPIGMFGQWTLKLQVSRDAAADVNAVFSLSAMGP